MLSCPSISTSSLTPSSQVHTEVNRLITSRVPLALPPYSPNPFLYLQGLTSISQLYFSFEEAWQELIYAFLGGDKKDDGQQAFLARLVEPRLWRTQRLEADIAFLTEKVGAAQEPAKEELQARIKAAVAEKPHLLLAHAWVLYMAVFSGGRHIRAMLVGAGKEFWGTDGEGGKSFFYFEGQEDGEDIRTEFKRRFLEADGLFSEIQKDEIVAEAKWIFDAVIGTVTALDQQLGPPKSPTAVESEGLRQRKLNPHDRILESLNEYAAEKDGQRPLSHPSLVLTEGMSFSYGLAAILFGVALWYGIWSYGPRERLLDWLF